MTRPHLIGLTGSVGMGKSTTAQLFRDAGIPVWDADAVVHRLYGVDGLAVAPLRALRPEAVDANTVSRAALRIWMAQDSSALEKIEAIVHPMVARDREQFIAAHDEAEILVLDIPLLFETGAETQCDTIAVVSTAPARAQRARVLSRSGMTNAELEMDSLQATA